LPFSGRKPRRREDTEPKQRQSKRRIKNSLNLLRGMGPLGSGRTKHRTQVEKTCQAPEKRAPGSWRPKRKEIATWAHAKRNM
jgi:hypothetical protein